MILQRGFRMSPDPLDEIVPVVDAAGHVLSMTTKKNAHDVGLLHPTILAEVIDSRGNWILVRQSTGRQDAGQYVSPVGGHMRAGESEADALKREAMEEMGISDFTFKRIGTGVFNREVLGRLENHLFILYEITSDQEPVLNHESDEFRRFTETELKEAMKQNPESFGDAWWFVVSSFYPQLLPG